MYNPCFLVNSKKQKKTKKEKRKNLEFINNSIIYVLSYKFICYNDKFFFVCDVLFDPRIEIWKNVRFWLDPNQFVPDNWLE